MGQVYFTHILPRYVARMLVGCNPLHPIQTDPLVGTSPKGLPADYRVKWVGVSRCVLM